MFCKNCGKPTENDEVLCKECAAAAAAPVAPVAQEVVPPVVEEAAPPVVEEVVPPVVEEAAPVEEAVVPPVSEEPPVFAEEIPPVVEEPAFTVASTEDAPKKKKKKEKKKKKKGLTIGIISGVVAVLGVLCFFFWPLICGIFNMLFLPADTHLKKVETKAIEKNADKLADEYEKLLNTKFDFSSSGNVDSRVQVSDDVISLLKPYLPEEFGDGQWLTDILLNVDYSLTDTAMQYTIGIGLKEEQLLTVKLVGDFEEGLLYCTIPELNATPIVLEMDVDSYIQIMDSTYEAQVSQDLIEAVIKSLPDKQTFRDMFVEYATLMVSQFDQVEKEQTQIATGGQSMNVTALIATVQGDDFYDAIEAVLVKAQTDTRITDFLARLDTNLKEVIPEAEGSFDTSEYTTSVADAIDEIRDLRANIDYSQSLQYTVYVDRRDNIVGRKFATMEGGVATEVFHYYTLYSAKDNYTYEVYIPGTETSESIRLAGTYVKADNVKNITCSVEIDNVNYLTVDVQNLTDTSGLIHLKPGKALVEMVLEELELGIPAAAINDLALEIDFNGTKYVLSAKAGGEALLTIHLDAEKGVESITLPSSGANLENEYQMFVWLGKANFDEVFDSLEEAGVPEELVDSLKEQLAQMVQSQF